MDDFDDGDEEEITTAERMKRTAETVEELGKSVASDEVAFATLVPELVNGSGRLGDFGRGLGVGATKPRVIWDRLVAEVKASQNPNVQVLLGFLSGLGARDIAEANALLDESVDHPTMGAWLP